MAVRSSQKLAPWFFGPYKIIGKVVEVAYRLDLPPEVRIYSTFHISLLKLCPNPSVKQRHRPIKSPAVRASLYHEKILNKRREG